MSLPDPIVALVRCDSYEATPEAVGRLFEMLELDELFRNQRALLKVNLMKGAAESEAVNTHPAVTEAVSAEIARAGGSSWVGDSSGVLGFTDECFDAAGYHAERFPERVNFDAGPFAWHDFGGRLLREAPVAESILAATVRVSMAKLKTHTLTLFTGALKNGFGILPGSVKPSLHRDICPTPASLAQVVVDINRGVPFQLGIMDGVIGREGGGTNTGQARPAHFLAASRDLVALDAVSCYLISIDPGKIKTLKLAERQGLGTANLSDICLVGDDIDDIRCEFVRPSFDWKRLSPFAKLAYGLRASSIFPEIDAEKCEACRECENVCPADAITVNGRAIIDRKKCINCYACHYHCPSSAVNLRCRPILKSVFRKRASGLDLSKLV